MFDLALREIKAISHLLVVHQSKEQKIICIMFVAFVLYKYQLKYSMYVCYVLILLRPVFVDSKSARNI